MYNDIWRKWLGVKNNEDVKQLIRSRELDIKFNQWTFSDEKWQTFPRLTYLENGEIVQSNANKKVEWIFSLPV
jgi:hypothetical protein